MNTKITKVYFDWKDVKNKCRTTVNKGSSDKDATRTFKENLLISEHSPIRIIKISWLWESIKSWITVHYARHHIGCEKWVSTQRTDRTGVNRDESTQDTPVRMEMEANAQALINIGKVRLCYQASKETREYMENLKKTIREIGEDGKILSNVIVPQCIYRCGCSELFGDCKFFHTFKKYAIDHGYAEGDLFDIKTRYKIYNQMFYKSENN